MYGFRDGEGTDLGRGSELKTFRKLLEARGIALRPELLRLKGDLQLKTHPGGKETLQTAEREFRAAIGLAQSIGAKSYELRATISLARLLQRHTVMKKAVPPYRRS